MHSAAASITTQLCKASELTKPEPSLTKSRFGSLTLFSNLVTTHRREISSASGKAVRSPMQMHKTDVPRAAAASESHPPRRLHEYRLVDSSRPNLQAESYLMISTALSCSQGTFHFGIHLLTCVLAASDRKRAARHSLATHGQTVLKCRRSSCGILLKIMGTEMPSPYQWTPI